MKRLGILVLALAGLTALLGSCGGGDEDQAGILAVAFRLDGGSPLMSAYIGDPAQDPFQLPPGRYYIEAVDQKGLTISLGEVDSRPGAVLEFSPSFEAAGGAEDTSRAETLKTIANFLIDAELAKFTALEVVSDGFKEPLFDQNIELDVEKFDRLYELYSEIPAQEGAVLVAIDKIESRAEASVRVPYVRAAPAPATGVFDSIKDELFDFFGYAGGAGERAREDIIEVAEEMTPDEKADAFLDIRAGFLDGATNFDQFLDNLRTGDLDNEAAQIRNDLWKNANFATVAQDICDCNSPSLASAHEEGAKLVEKGAELNVQVIRTVLGDVFPDISRGFDLADEIDEWAEYVNVMYKDPLGTLEGQSRDEIEGRIKELIESSLSDCCPRLGEDLADEVAGAISEAVVGEIPELAPLLRGGPSPTPVPAPIATARATATAAPPSPTAQATLAPAATPEQTPEPEPTPMPEATAEPAATPEATPTPDLSWIEGVVQDVIAALAAERVSQEEAQRVGDDVRLCLTVEATAGASRAEAIDNCQERYQPEEQPPGVVEVRGALDPAPFVENPGFTHFEANEIVLRFPTGGGDVTGELNTAEMYLWTDSYRGAACTERITLSGTLEGTYDGVALSGTMTWSTSRSIVSGCEDDEPGGTGVWNWSGTFDGEQVTGTMYRGWAFTASVVSRGNQ